jgi:hypothetical protein
MRSTQAHGEFARARAQAEQDERVLRDRAARTVAGQAVNTEDLYSLLAMLGLDRPDATAPLRSGLAGYIRAVAAAMRVPIEATDFEISDTTTAYLALTERWILRPGRDLMLLWTEVHGWSVAVETAPTESPFVLGYLGGDDVVPSPHAVARFVTDLVNGPGKPFACPSYPVADGRAELTRRLTRYKSMST